MRARSLLFVPGNRPDRFEKACESGADLVCIDLEDAVGPIDKIQARKQSIRWLSQNSSKHSLAGLRINPPDTDAGKEDISLLIEIGAREGLTLPFVMIPKAASAAQINVLEAQLPVMLGPFFAIIESAAGLVNCEDIFSNPRTSYGMYGAIDYAGDVGCDQSWDTHLYGRSRCVSSARAHDVQMFGGPHTDIADLEDCERSTLALKSLGIHARSAIHPTQIAAIHTALRPSRAEILHAKRIIEAYDAVGGNAALLDGKFIEAPVVKHALRVLSWLDRT